MEGFSFQSFHTVELALLLPPVFNSAKQCILKPWEIRLKFGCSGLLWKLKCHRQESVWARTSENDNCSENGPLLPACLAAPSDTCSTCCEAATTGSRQEGSLSLSVTHNAANRWLCCKWAERSRKQRWTDTQFVLAGITKQALPSRGCNCSCTAETRWLRKVKLTVAWSLQMGLGNESSQSLLLDLGFFRKR